MKREELEAIIEKYYKMSENVSLYGENKCANYEYIAGKIEDNIFDFIDDEHFETEEDVVEYVRENYYPFWKLEDLVDIGLIDESWLDKD